jgi:hypothetical protein
MAVLPWKDERNIVMLVTAEEAGNGPVRLIEKPTGQLDVPFVHNFVVRQ